MKKELIVIKAGTGSLRLNGVPHIEIFFSIARQIAQIKREGFGAVLISSGAVDAGKRWVCLLGGNPGDFKAGELSSIGTEPLLALWRDAFLPHGLGISMGWLMNSVWNNREQRENLRVSGHRLAFSPFVPIVNEHDLLSRRELLKMRRGEGDNDYLARRVACLLDASAILFLTESGGIWNGVPGDGKSRLWRTLDGRVTYRLRKRNNGVSSTGTGGPQSKINQASFCFRRGMRAAISGHTVDIIPRFAHREIVPTTIGTENVFC